MYTRIQYCPGLLVVALLSGIVFIGCAAASGVAGKGDGSSPLRSWREYFPPTAGMTFTYRLMRIDDKEEETDAVLVSTIETADAEKVVLRTGSRQIVYRIAKDGLIKDRSGNYLLKEPLRPGSRWEITLGDETGVAEVLATDATVVTAAGTFENCLVLRERPASEEITLTTTYAPGVGIVRIVTSFTLDDKEYINEEADLTSFSRP